MKLKSIKPKINKAKLYRYAFNTACNMLVVAGQYNSTKHAEKSLLNETKKNYGNFEEVEKVFKPKV